MKPTKRQSDPLGRSTTRQRSSRYLLSLALAITGSVWPIQARSIEPIFDTLTTCLTGLRCTAQIGDQLRVSPDHRRGVWQRPPCRRRGDRPGEHGLCRDGRSE